MNAAADAGRGIGELARIGLGVGDQLLDVFRRHRRMHHQHQRAGADQADRLEILARVVADIAVERRIDRQRPGAAEHQRVAVRRGLGDRARRDRAARAAAVLDHDLLAEHRAHLVGGDTRHDVVAAAGRVGHHQRDRPVGVVALRRGRRCGRHGPSKSQQGQAPSARRHALRSSIRPGYWLPAAGYCRAFRVIDKRLFCEEPRRRWTPEFRITAASRRIDRQFRCSCRV